MSKPILALTELLNSWHKYIFVTFQAVRFHFSLHYITNDYVARMFIYLYT